MSIQTVIHGISPKLLDIRKHIRSYSTLEWLRAREHNMSTLKSCIATEHRCHIEDIDIGVGEEMLLGDLLLRIKSKGEPLATETRDSELETTLERMRGLMASIPQFGTHTDHLCPDLAELFCICLHAMVYATIDIMDRKSSLPTVQEIMSIMKALPVVHGAEVRKKELTVRVLAAAYREALYQNGLVFLPSVNRENIMHELSFIGTTAWLCRIYLPTKSS